MEKKALVIVNPSSGREKAEQHAEDVVKILQKKYDAVTVRKTEGAGDAKKFASDAAEEGYDLVVAMGGDGTVNEAVNGLAPHDKIPKFGIVPMGTVNDLARVLGISLDPEEAVSVFEEEHLQAIDIGRIGDRYFNNAMSLGDISESIYQVTPEEKSRLGPLAYLVAGAKKMMEQKNIRVNLKYDGKSMDVELAALVIVLTGSIIGIQDVIPTADLEDGKLHIVLIHELNFVEGMKLLPKVFSGEVTESENVTYIITDKISIESLTDENYTSDIDGEEGPKLPFTVEALKSHIQILVPPKNEENK